MKYLKYRKFPRQDGLQNELLMYGGEKVTNTYRSYTEHSNQSSIPNRWRKRTTSVVFKKGDKHAPTRLTVLCHSQINIKLSDLQDHV